MRTILSAVLVSIFALSAPAFASVKQNAADGAKPVTTDAKPVAAKSSAPATTDVKPRARKVKKPRTTASTSTSATKPVDNKSTVEAPVAK
jgi:hypothetical protein